MDDENVLAAKSRVERRTELRKQAAESGRKFPSSFSNGLRAQVAQDDRDSALIVKMNQLEGAWCHAYV